MRSRGESVREREPEHTNSSSPSLVNTANLIWPRNAIRVSLQARRAPSSVKSNIWGPVLMLANFSGPATPERGPGGVSTRSAATLTPAAISSSGAVVSTNQYQHQHISTLDVFDDTLESSPDLARGSAKRGLLKVGELTRPPRVPVSEVNDITHQGN